MLNLFRRHRETNLLDPTSLSCSDKLSWLDPQHKQYSSTSSEACVSERAEVSIDHEVCRGPLQWKPSILSGSAGRSQGKQKARHVVTFKTIKVRKTLSRAQYNSNELESCWWSLAEYLALERDRKRAIESGNHILGTSHSVHKSHTRGLDSYIHSTAAVQKQRRTKAIYTVLFLQEEQRHAGVHNPEAIAKEYHAVSRLSELQALHIATQDQQEAQATQNVTDGSQHSESTSGDSSASNRRKVTFNPKVKARTIRNRKHYTLQERKDCWYSRAETKAILRSCAVLLKTQNAEEKQAATEDLEDCMRGLELHTPEGFRVKTEHRKNAYRSVLLVLAAEEKVRFQSRRRREAVADAVAASYRRASSECCLEAIERALIDQTEADKVYQDQS